jgi:alkylated DNA repair dioxygenase AlkB
MGDLGMINGLTLIDSYIDQHQHDWLIKVIDAAQWLTELKRRVQHYGYKYDYRKRAIDHSMAAPSPIWVQRLAAKVFADGHTPAIPDQVIVNEYQSGQGIGAHVDCEPCFGGVILSISLLSPVVMDFRHRQTKRHIEIVLSPRSLLIMSGESRYDWTHGIAARSHDVIGGVKQPRLRRVSMTLRNVLLAGTPKVCEV